jgi:hypothetical protein
MNPIDQLCLPLAEKLWAVHGDVTGGPRLIFPFKRTDVVRVSEQESKILLCQVLEEGPYFYSIETPTREMYMQSGSYGLSARIDVTVYGSRAASDRILNIELKSGTADLEAFRKDFEKLAREGVDGLWFHTLERADTRTLRTLFTRMNDAMELVRAHAIAARHTLTIALCLLESQVLLTTQIQFGENLTTSLAAALGHASTNWTVSGPGALTYGVLAIPTSEDSGGRFGLTRARSTIDRTGREKLLIYCPEITEDTLLHFSQVGDSYRLRAFAGKLAGRQPWMEPGITSASEFLRRYAPATVIDVRLEGFPVDQPGRWVPIVNAHNRRLGIA